MIQYGAPIWATTTKSNIDRIQSYQIKAARTILSQKWIRNRNKQHRQDVLNQLKWPNVNQLVNTAILNLTKSAINQLSSAGINKMFTTSNPRNPRTGHAMRIAHKGRISTTQKTFGTIATTLFNQLPASIRNPTWSSTKFKKLLKIYMTGQFLLTKH